MIPATILSWAAPGALRTGCGLAHNPRRYEYLLAGGPGRSGRGYGPLSMRIEQPAVDMFSLSVQVVGKNVSSSSSGRASEKRGDSRRYERCYSDRDQRSLRERLRGRHPAG